MEKLNLEGSWEEMKKKVLEAEPQLAPEDVDFTEGEYRELVRRLAEKLSRNEEHVKGWIESVSSSEGKAS